MGEKIINMKKCIFCGEVLNENLTCPNAERHFKPMCLNCEFCSEHSEGGYQCTNETIISRKIEKIKLANQDCEIKALEVILPLKDETKKCPNYKLDVENITEYYKNL